MNCRLKLVSTTFMPMTVRYRNVAPRGVIGSVSSGLYLTLTVEFVDSKSSGPAFLLRRKQYVGMFLCPKKVTISLDIVYTCTKAFQNAYHL